MSLGRLVPTLLLGLLSCGPDRSSLPSIVLVTLDTVRCDHLGLYGDTRGLSPHLDALARQGLVYERAFTTMPTTGPAHLSLFTGLYPSEHGSRENGEPLDEIHAPRELSVRLAARGYATAAFVTTPLLHPRVTGLRGFAIHDGPRGVLRPGSEAVEAALRWLSVEERRPVFLWVHLYDAHAPYGSADEKRYSIPLAPGRYGWVEAGHLDAQERARMAESYATGVRAADAALGDLVAGLRDRLERTPLLVVVGDHGEALDEHLLPRGYAYDHGEFLDEDVVCVPLVLQGPGVKAGRSLAAASLRDLYTTLLAGAGVPDELATDEDRLDLRTAAPPGRIVAVERRRVGPDARPLVRSHAAAAFDGTAGVIVSEDGLPTASASPDNQLLASARKQVAASPGRAGAPDVDADLREALQALGYAE